MITHDAVFSPCRRYRYTLWRAWDMSNHTYLQVIGLNPSTADETHDDPTLRRCIRFAKAWGYGAVCMTNLFAYRSPHPRDLTTVEDPIGPDNDAWLQAMAHDATVILAAWGTMGVYRWRSEHIRNVLQTFPLVCLGINTNGTPKHPLYIAKSTQPYAYL